MVRYTCVSGPDIDCSTVFLTLDAARSHDNNDGHSVIDVFGTPIKEYPGGDS